MKKRVALLCALSAAVLLAASCTAPTGGSNPPPVAAVTATPSAGPAPLAVAFSGSGSTDNGSIVSYAWNFGDPGSGASNTATGVTASHTYAAAGTYSAVLSVTDNGGLVRTAARIITVSASNTPPVAVTSASAPTSGPAPLTVSFSSSGSSDPDGTIEDYLWQFGDGPASNSSQPDPTHTYATPGTYTATLTVTDDDGATTTESVSITVDPNLAPTAAATATPQNGTVPLTVAFDGSGSSDPEAQALTYDWNFGDPASGPADTATGATPTHTYGTAGPYTATLTVTDVGGLTDVTTVVVTAAPANQAPVADASSSAPLSGVAPLAVSFSAAGSDDTDGTIASYDWDFGDPSSGPANTATGATAAHTYASSGAYTATLTVTDDDGATDTAQVAVTVADNQPPTAIANSSTNTGSASLAVTFTSSSTDNDGTVATTAWDFGDGSPAGSGATVDHTYSLPGTYTATLTVTDDLGATDATTIAITVTAVANARYVDTSGSNTGTCSTAATACLTVQYAVDQAAAGDTIYLGPGSYPERVALSKDVTLHGANAGVAGSAPRAPESVVKGVSNAWAGSVTDASSTTYSGAVTAATNTSTVASITGAGAISAASGGGAISGVTGSGVSPIVITTAAPHELTTGNSITVSGVGGNTAANTTKAVTVIDATHFSLDGTTGNGAYTSGGAYRGGPVYITTSAPHGLNVGQTYTGVTIAGLVGNTSANGVGTRSITVLDASRFQVNSVTANGTYTSGGTYSNILAVITTSAPHNLANGAKVNITGIVGTTNLNGTNRTVTVVDANRFTVALVASTAYASGGLVTSAQVVLTTDAPHGIPASNAPITVSGVGGNTAANGNKTVTVLDATHLLLVSTAPNGDYTGGGTFTSAPVIVTTGSPHGLTAGRIVVQDVAGNTAANGTWSTTLIDSSRLLLNGVSANGTYAGGGHYGNPLGTLVSGATNASPIVLTLNGPHGLSTGNTVTVAGAVGNTAANGTFVVTAVSPNQIALNGTTGNGTWTSGGTVSGAQLNVTMDGLSIDPQGDSTLIATGSNAPVPLVSLFGGPSETVRNSVFTGGAFAPACSFTCTTNVDYAFQVQTGAVTFADNLVRNFRRPVNITTNSGGTAPTVATVSGNVFSGTTSRSVALGNATGNPMPGATVTGNTFDSTGNTSSPAGITIVNGGNTVSGNTFTGLSSGVYLSQCKKWNTDNNHITGNSFINNGVGVYVAAGLDGGQCTSSTTEGTGGWLTGGGRINGLTITGNNFTGQTSPAVYHNDWPVGVTPAISSGPIDVTCNWWGSAAAPGTGANGLLFAASPEPVFTATPYRTAPAPDGACDGV